MFSKYRFNIGKFVSSFQQQKTSQVNKMTQIFIIIIIITIAQHLLQTADILSQYHIYFSGKYSFAVWIQDGCNIACSFLSSVCEPLGLCYCYECICLRANGVISVSKSILMKGKIWNRWFAIRRNNDINGSVNKGSDQLLKITGCGNECMMYCAFSFCTSFCVQLSL